MKNLLLLGCLLAAGPLAAQTKVKTKVKPGRNATQVSAATVARVVRTLAADDMQGRGTGQPGGLRAAQFLAGEFQRIGLQPLAGLTGFEQTFTAYQTKPEAAALVLNGQAVAPARCSLCPASPA